MDRRQERPPDETKKQLKTEGSEVEGEKRTSFFNVTSLQEENGREGEFTSTLQADFHLGLHSSLVSPPSFPLNQCLSGSSSWSGHRDRRPPIVGKLLMSAVTGIKTKRESI